MKTSVSKFLLSRFQQLHVDTVFTTPGPNTHSILKEISNDKNLQIVPGNNDFESAFSAIGYSKTKGVSPVGSQHVGVVICSSSTIQSAISAVQVACHDHVPIVIVNCLPSSHQDLKMLDQLSSGTQSIRSQCSKNMEHFESLSVHSAKITSSQLASSQIDCALQVAMTLCGPVYLEMPENLWNQETYVPSSEILPKRLVSEALQMHEAIKLLTFAFKESKRPLVWFGSNVVRFGARSDAMKWISKNGINFVTSLGGKSMSDEKNERFVGVYAGKSSNKNVIDAISNSDLIVVVGETGTENESIGQSLQNITTKRKILVNWNSVIENGLLIASPVYLKDVMVMCAQSNEFTQEPSLNFCHEKESIQMNSQHGLTYDGIVLGFNHSSVISNAISFVDGTLGMISTLTLSCKQDTFVGTNSFSFGSSIATCIGSYLANPNKRPIVLVGNGAFLTSTSSLATLTKIRSNAIIVVFNNGMHGLNQWVSNPKVFEDPKDPIDPFNVTSKVNLAKLADSLDAIYLHCDNYSSLSDAIKRIESVDRVVVLDCVIPQKDLPRGAMWRLSLFDDVEDTWNRLWV